MHIRPRRSVLYMPGSNTRAMEKARTLPADAIIMDLEDAVSPEAKEMARSQVVSAVTEGGYGKRELIVRVNPLDSAWGQDDIAAIARTPVDAVLLPKVETPEQIHAAVATLDQAGAAPDLPVWLMVETPRGVLQVNAIASSHPRLDCIVMGTSDLLKELRGLQSPDRIALLAPIGLSILAARANGLNIIDGVYVDLSDSAGFTAACAQARKMGFDGKSLIHPKQIELANELFTPSREEVANAKAIVAEWEEAQKEGKGVVVVNGKMVERLHVEEARRVIALTSAINEISGN